MDFVKQIRERKVIREKRREVRWNRFKNLLNEYMDAKGRFYRGLSRMIKTDIKSIPEKINIFPTSPNLGEF